MTYAAYKCDLRRMQPSVWETAQMDPSFAREMEGAFDVAFELRQPSSRRGDAIGLQMRTSEDVAYELGRS